MIYIRNKLVFNFKFRLHNIENVAYMWYNYIYVNEIINRRDNMIEKEIYIERISKDYDVSKEAIYAQTNKLQYANSKGSQVLERNITHIKPKKETKKGLFSKSKK